MVYGSRAFILSVPDGSDARPPVYRLETIFEGDAMRSRLKKQMALCESVG
jgi:hypothetical protein